MTAFVLLTLSFATYQANVPFTVAGIASFMLFRYENLAKRRDSDSWKQFLRDGLLVTFVFLLAYVAYSFITNTFFWSSDYLSSQIMWKTRDLHTCIKAVTTYIFDVLTARVHGETGALLFGIVVSFGIKLARSFTPHVGVRLIALSWASYVVLCTSPFLLAFYMGWSITPRSQFAAPLVASSLIVYSANASLRGRAQRIASILVLLGAVIFSASGIGKTQRAFYTDDVRYQQEYEYASEIVETLETDYSEEIQQQPVVFVGKWSAPLNGACSKENMWGRTLFEHDYVRGNATGNTLRCSEFISAAFGLDLIEPTKDDLAVAVNLAESMPCYPSRSSILSANGVVVVKLSEWDVEAIW